MTGIPPIVRQHITMLGRHFATGHPAVNSAKYQASAERVLKAAEEQELVEFANFFESELEALLFFAPPEKFGPMFELYVDIWERLYTKRQKDNSLRRFREVRDQMRKWSLEAREAAKKYGGSNATLSERLFDASREIKADLEERKSRKPKRGRVEDFGLGLIGVGFALPILMGLTILVRWTLVSWGYDEKAMDKFGALVWAMLFISLGGVPVGGFIWLIGKLFKC